MISVPHPAPHGQQQRKAEVVAVIGDIAEVDASLL